MRRAGGEECWRKIETQNSWLPNQKVRSGTCEVRVLVAPELDSQLERQREVLNLINFQIAMNNDALQRAFR